MALAGNGRWCYLDPKLGAMHAVAEAARKVACTGATPVAATNCLNFGNPEKPEIMAQLSAAIDGIAEACTALGTPITGGNVSLYNETRGEGIYPTPVVGVVGILDDVTNAVPSGFQTVGDVILVWRPYSADFDEERDDFLYERTFGSSEYAKAGLGAFWGTPPGIAMEFDARVHTVLKTLAGRSLVSSVSDVADGGLAMALARATFEERVGARVDLGSVGRAGRTSITLFGEAACSILISCPRPSVERVKETVRAAELGGLTGIGITTGQSLEVLLQGDTKISATIADLRSAWSTALESHLSEEVTA
jgi:phosphoribosylformylglycinamidine synthase